MVKKILLVSGAVLGMSMPVAAQESADTVSTSTVYACAEISADTERLACYDAAVGRLKQAEESGEVVTVTREQVEEVKRDSFGFSLPSLPKLVMPKFGDGSADDGKLDELVAPVASASRDGYGKIVVTLDNGQVWRQTDDKSLPSATWKRAKEVRITTGMVGSYFLTIDGKRTFKAERVK